MDSRLRGNDSRKTMEIFQQFGVQPILLAAQVVNFLILLFILKKFLYKPILKVLDERKRKIEESLNNATEIERKLSQTNETIEKMIGKAALDAQKMLDETKKAIVDMKEQGQLQAQQQAQIITKAGEEKVKELQLLMQKQIKEEVSKIVMIAFAKVTGKVLSSKTQKQMIEKEIEDLKI